MSSLTTDHHDQKTYQSPLISRYSSAEMGTLFSPYHKHHTWRRLWIALAKCEKELGLHITEEQIEEMEINSETIHFDVVAEYEEQLQHDVMAHIYAFADLCPNAKPIIHLGATSCYVTDNTDLIIMREALALLRKKLVKVINQLSQFASDFADLPTLSYTHFQPAQPTTVGKRACLWIQDFQMDLEELDHRLDRLQFLGVKGTTGTQASFLTLFEGDHEKVKALDSAVAHEMGFNSVYPVSGQTYSRKVDELILNTVSGIGTSAHKCATDLRLLSHLKEIDEPFKSKQVGSSAMPYKRNPILTERICSLARFLMSLNQNATYTAATQWLERSLDDSANRRLSIPESFLTCDAILNLLIKLSHGLVVNEASVRRNLNEALPFMITETLLIEGVKRGGDRQELHEKIRQHSLATAHRIKHEDGHNDLFERIANDPTFSIGLTELEEITKTLNLTGRSAQQVEDFLQ